MKHSKYYSYIISLIILLLLMITSSSCSSYHSTRPAPLNTNPIAQQNKKVIDGVESMVYPITTQSMQKQVFDNDLVKKGYLPVQIAIINKRDTSITFTKDYVMLLTPNEAVIQTISNYDVAQNTDKSIWRTIGWTIGGGVFGLIPSAMNVSKTNKRIQADYEAKAPIEGNLVPSAMVDGLIFFQLPEEEIKTLDGYTISIALHDNLSNDDINIKHHLYGDIDYKGRDVHKEENINQDEMY